MDLIQTRETVPVDRPGTGTRTRAGLARPAGGRIARIGGVGGRKWRSRPLSRVLSWTVIPLGPASPQASSSQPGCGTSHAIAPLFGLAPGGVCRAPGRCPPGRWALTPPFRPYHAPFRAVRRFVFCCTFRRLTPPRRYLAPCSVEPGLSSAHCCDATVLAGSAACILAHRGGGYLNADQSGWRRIKSDQSVVWSTPETAPQRIDPIPIAFIRSYPLSSALIRVQKTNPPTGHHLHRRGPCGGRR